MAWKRPRVRVPLPPLSLLLSTLPRSSHRGLGRVVRRLYTLSDLSRRGVTRFALQRGEQQGRWRKVDTDVYAEGPDDPSPLDKARAAVIATGGIACGTFAGWLLRLDGVAFDGPHLVVGPGCNGRRPGARRRVLPSERVVSVD